MAVTVYDVDFEKIEVDEEGFWYVNLVVDERKFMGTKEQVHNWISDGGWRSNIPGAYETNIDLDDGKKHCCRMSDTESDTYTIDPPYTGNSCTMSIWYSFDSEHQRVVVTPPVCKVTYGQSLWRTINRKIEHRLQDKRGAIEEHFGVLGRCFECGALIYNEYEFRDVCDQEAPRPVCDSCWDSCSFTCDCCGGTAIGYHTGVQTAEDRYSHLCHTCYDTLYYQLSDPQSCYECDYLYDWEDTHTSYCPHCDEHHHWTAEEQAWNYKPPMMFTHAKDQQYGVQQVDARYIGCELEMEGGDCYRYRNMLYNKLKSAGYDRHVYFMHDGSLDDGCETATVPIELNYALTEYPFDTIHAVAQKCAMRSHQTNTCGFHIHVNRASIPDFELTMAKVLLTFDKFYDKLLTFSRRRAKDRPEHWCAKPNVDIQKSDSPRDIHDKLYLARDHYRAVNMIPRDTVEFRLWKGTHNPDTIRATIDFLSTLIDVCAETDLEDLYDWTWEEFIAVAAPMWKLERTGEYVASRGLM